MGKSRKYDKMFALSKKNYFLTDTQTNIKYPYTDIFQLKNDGKAKKCNGLLAVLQNCVCKFRARTRATMQTFPIYTCVVCVCVTCYISNL